MLDAIRFRGPHCLHHWRSERRQLQAYARTGIDATLEDLGDALDRAAADASKRELAAALADLGDAERDVLLLHAWAELSDGEIIEMLAQHLITKPVFDALFDSYSFAKHNPMSQAMQAVLDLLNEHRLDKEADTLQAFYDSVKLRAEGIDNAAGKQKIIVELYEKFFRNAFPKMAERLGIVYTPVEVVDFIIHSVDHILSSEFGESLGSKNVHITLPFVGT